MPIAPVTYNREEIVEVIADRTHIIREESNWLDKSYFTEDAQGEILVRPGLILARNSTTNEYIPYSSGNHYGPGSNTAVAVLDDIQNATYDKPHIAPVSHGRVIEANCYVYGATYTQTVPAAVKTALQQIVWV